MGYKISNKGRVIQPNQDNIRTCVMLVFVTSLLLYAGSAWKCCGYLMIRHQMTETRKIGKERKNNSLNQTILKHIDSKWSHFHISSAGLDEQRVAHINKDFWTSNHFRWIQVNKSQKASQKTSQLKKFKATEYCIQSNRQK